MPSVYPGALDAFPTPGSTTFMDDPGYQGDVLMEDALSAAEALEVKVGTGAAVPTTVGDVLAVTGAGATGFTSASGLVAPSLARNIIINGNYDQWQRTVSAAQTCPTTFNALTSFGPDRMYTLPAGASISAQRTATVPANGLALYGCILIGAVSVTTVDHGQRIHSKYRHRYKRSLMFSAQVLNQSGSAFTPLLRIDTPAAADDWTTPTNRLSQSLQSCADSVYTQVSAIIDPSAFTNIDNGMSIYLRVPSGSLVASKFVTVAQFDLRASTTVLTFVPPDPDDELRRCQAYVNKTFAQGVAPAQNVGSTVGALYTVTQVAGAAAANMAPWTFPVTMIKTPAITTYNPSAANALWRNASVGADSGAATAVNISDRGCSVFQAQVAGDVATSQCSLHALAIAELS